MKKKIYNILYFIATVLMKLLSLLTHKNNPKINDDEPISEQYTVQPIYTDTAFLDESVCKEKFNLSIVIPVYNAEKVIKKCLDSLISQKTDYKYQIILVNDGSTDNSLNIIKDYESKYKNVFVIDQSNGGASIARNRGIRSASGDYIGFVDSDDWVTEDYIEKLLSRAYATNADIVKCNHINYSLTEDKVLAVIRHDDFSVVGKFDLSIMSIKGYVWGGVIKKSIFDKVRFPEKYWYEDVIMRTLIMRLSNRYEHIDEELYYYALHQKNSSKNLWKENGLKCLDFFYLMKYIMEETYRLGLDKDYVYRNIILYEFGALMWQRTKHLDKKMRKKIFFRCCRLLESEHLNLTDDFFRTNKYFAKAFINKDFYLWEISAIQSILRVNTDFV